MKYKMPLSLVQGHEKDIDACSDFVFKINGEELELLKMYEAYQMSENAQAH